MARCENCNKFTSLNFEDPEMGTFNEYLELDPEDGAVRGTVSADVRIYRTSECCGDEKKEANLDLETEVEIDHEKMLPHVEQVDGKWAWKSGCGVAIDHDDPGQVEEGGGRYKKSYFGACVSFTVTCDCQAKSKDKTEPLYEGTMEDKVNAASMDEV